MNKKVVIFSDSKSALDAIKNHLYAQNNFIIYYIKQNILLASEQGIIITLFWIPSHVGIPGNERADETASINGLSSAFKIPHEDLYAVSKECLKSRFEGYLRSVATHKGTHHQEFFPMCSEKPWFNKSTLSRNEIVMINRFRSNHYNLNSSLYRVNIVDSPACPCGDNFQDINHVIIFSDASSLNTNLSNYVLISILNSLNLLQTFSLPSPIPLLNSADS